MAHFAKINNNTNQVETVIVVSNNNCGGGNFPESEPIGQEFINKMGLSGIWKQTSYNKNFRVHYAGVGYTYDETRDAFIPPKIYDSWILNEDTLIWEPPVPHPNDGKIYNWNESIGEWEEENS